MWNDGLDLHDSKKLVYEGHGTDLRDGRLDLLEDIGLAARVSKDSVKMAFDCVVLAIDDDGRAIIWCCDRYSTLLEHFPIQGGAHPNEDTHTFHGPIGHGSGRCGRCNTKRCLLQDVIRSIETSSLCRMHEDRTLPLSRA
jgi:hypothetical protein